MSYADLPMCCRQCAHRETRYVFPAWNHDCIKGKPMKDACEWRQARHPNFEENERARPGN